MKLGINHSIKTIRNNYQNALDNNYKLELYYDYLFLDIYNQDNTGIVTEVLFIHIIGDKVYQTVEQFYTYNTDEITETIKQYIKYMKEFKYFKCKPHNEIRCYNTLSEVYIHSIYTYNAKSLDLKIKEIGLS